MDRAEFLNRLEAQLLDVPQAEREEALQYYEDYLNDAGDAGDFDILQELGTPEEVADSIRNGLRQDSSGAGERSGQADENWQDSSRTGQLGDSGYFSENGYVDREPQKEELQRVKQLRAATVLMRTGRARIALQRMIPALPAEGSLRSGCGFC